MVVPGFIITSKADKGLLRNGMESSKQKNVIRIIPTLELEFNIFFIHLIYKSYTGRILELCVSAGPRSAIGRAPDS